MCPAPSCARVRPRPQSPKLAPPQPPSKSQRSKAPSTFPPSPQSRSREETQAPYKGVPGGWRGARIERRPSCTRPHPPLTSSSSAPTQQSHLPPSPRSVHIRRLLSASTHGNASRKFVFVELAEGREKCRGPAPWSPARNAARVPTRGPLRRCVAGNNNASCPCFREWEWEWECRGACLGRAFSQAGEEMGGGLLSHDRIDIT